VRIIIFGNRSRDETIVNAGFFQRGEAQKFTRQRSFGEKRRFHADFTTFACERLPKLKEWSEIRASDLIGGMNVRAG
jgi:hypothetical protein